MFLKKVLNQPNLVGSMLITLMICGGFVYAVGFDGFNVETATGGEVEAWLEAANGGGSGSGDLNRCKCSYQSKGLCHNCKSSKKPDNKPCGGQSADGCQPKCRQDNHDCTNNGGCIREVCKNSHFAGTRCRRHPDPKDYCPARNKGKAPGKG